jgi:hypothetical protein
MLKQLVIQSARAGKNELNLNSVRRSGIAALHSHAERLLLAVLRVQAEKLRSLIRNPQSH